MWFIVNTDQFKEQETKEFLDNTYPGTVKYTYLPKCRVKYTNATGEESFRFTPLIHGLLFVKADNAEALKSILTPWGYFFHQEQVRNIVSGTLETTKLVSTAHLLCSNVKDAGIDTIIKSATVPDEDMERFIYYSDRVAEGIEGLSIVDKRYDELIQVNDTVRILSGPLAGWVGVVKQKKKQGKKDRHFLVRFGNTHCISFSNIRQYDIQVEHEATQGEKAEAVGAWRAIDQMIGYLQAKDPEKNACQTLRQLLVDYQKKPTVYRSRYTSDKTYNDKKEEKTIAHRQTVLEHLAPSMQGNFRTLSNYCKAGESTLLQWLNELIPDATLRPFLTPTSGPVIPKDQNYTVLRHNGITELILRCNLRESFQNQPLCQGKDEDKDEDYEYYAHFALLETEQGKVKAICSWGSFYDYYASQSEAERERFLADLEAKKYPRLHHLLTQSEWKFEKVVNIGGFSIETDVDYTSDNDELGNRIAEFFTQSPSPVPNETTPFLRLTSAAVEMWQGTRLLVWRQLLQRYVLLHKVPVADLVQEEKE